MAMYNHMYQRVEYPRERGYRMEVYKLPDWIQVEIIELGHDTKQLVVHSRIHVNKRVEMHPTYSASFSDHEIIRDLSGKVFSRFIK